MRKMLTNFPTEKLILHKPSNDVFEVTGLVSSSEITSEDGSIPIEKGDFFERVLPSGVIEYFEVIDPGFHKGTGGIPDHYQTKIQHISAPIVYETQTNELPKMVFISHSSKDGEYTKAFVDLLFNIGLNEDDIVCSSYPGLGVPLGASVYEWLVEKFQKFNLHVFYFLSHNYYKSAACLNEMGAAWAMKQKWDGILLPGFSFSDITGCIDSSQIGIKLDGDTEELKHRLGELKDDIINEFGLREISNTRWEKIRSLFLEKIGSIQPYVEKDSDENALKSSIEKEKGVSVYAYVMLSYAANADGKIMVLQSFSGTTYRAGGIEMERNQTPREIAIWEDAVSRLEEKGWINIVGNRNDFRIYQVTADGYKVADAFKEQNNLDMDKNPADLLNESEN